VVDVTGIVELYYCPPAFLCIFERLSSIAFVAKSMDSRLVTPSSMQQNTISQSEVAYRVTPNKQ
jgi:hypothetical protein